MAAADSLKRPYEGDAAQPPVTVKRIRAAELPLSQTKRSEIDGTFYTFKKKGEFDALRKKAFSNFEQGDAKAMLHASLEAFAESEIEKHPYLLSKERRHAAPLIIGAVERSDIYKTLETGIAARVKELLGPETEAKMREIRRAEIGDEAAAEEDRRGAKTDEDYAREAQARKDERMRAREERNEKEREKEREERRRAAEEKRRKREEEEAREQEKLEREERRRKERAEREASRERKYELERAERREKERQWEREREERRERRRREEEEDRARHSYRDRRGSPSRDRRRSRSRDRDTRRQSVVEFVESTKPDGKPEEIKISDEDALAMLLAESEALKKSRQRPELERSGSLEPPPLRKPLAPKSLVPRDPHAARIAKLDKPSPKSADHAHTPSLKKEESALEEPGERRESSAAPSMRSRADKERRRSRSRSRRHSEARRSYSPEDRRSGRYDRYSSRYSSRYDESSRYKPNYEHDAKSSTRRSRSPSRTRDRERDDRRRSYRDDRSTERSRRHRSKTPPRRSYRDRSRSRSPMNIDRYVPGGGRKASTRDTEYRDRDRDGRDDRDRDHRRESYGGRDRDRRTDRRHFSEADRYIPGASSTRDGDKERERDRDRDRERGGGRERSRERRRERSRSRSRGSRR